MDRVFKNLLLLPFEVKPETSTSKVKFINQWVARIMNTIFPIDHIRAHHIIFSVTSSLSKIRSDNTKLS